MWTHAQIEQLTLLRGSGRQKRKHVTAEIIWFGSVLRTPAFEKYITFSFYKSLLLSTPAHHPPNTYSLMRKPILVLAVTELLVPHVMLWVGFVVKTVLITQRLFHYCWAELTGVKAFSVPHTALQGNSMVLQKRLGRDTGGIADPNGPKGYSIPYSIMVSSKRWGKKEKGMFEVMAFGLPVTCDEAPNSWRCQNTHLPTGHSAQIPCLAVQLFLYLVNCLCHNPRFLTFPFQFLPLWWVAVWGWAASWGLPTAQCHCKPLHLVSCCSHIFQEENHWPCLPWLTNLSKENLREHLIAVCHSRGRKAQRAERKKQHIC